MCRGTASQGVAGVGLLDGTGVAAPDGIGIVPGAGVTPLPSRRGAGVRSGWTRVNGAFAGVVVASGAGWPVILSIAVRGIDSRDRRSIRFRWSHCVWAPGPWRRWS